MKTTKIKCRVPRQPKKMRCRRRSSLYIIGNVFFNKLLVESAFHHQFEIWVFHCTRLCRSFFTMFTLNVWNGHSWQGFWLIHFIFSKILKYELKLMLRGKKLLRPIYLLISCWIVIEWKRNYCSKVLILQC